MSKKKAYLIPLILGLVLMAVGMMFFARICRVKDRVYKNYKVSLTDDSIREVIAKGADEEAVRKTFNTAVVKSDASDEMEQFQEMAPEAGAEGEDAAADAAST